MFHPEVIYSIELNLDSKGICFLCLTKTVDDDKKEGAEENVTFWGLENLSLFLGINLSEKVHQIFPNHQGLRIEWSDVKVHLCTKCNQIATRFSACESTELGLKWCVEQMIRELATSENDTGRMEEVNRTLKGLDDGDVTLRLMSSLRREVLERGSHKVKVDPTPSTELNQLKTKPPAEGVKGEVADVPLDQGLVVTVLLPQDVLPAPVKNMNELRSPATEGDLKEGTPPLGRENGSEKLKVGQPCSELGKVQRRRTPSAQGPVEMEESDPAPSSSVPRCPVPSIIPKLPPPPGEKSKRSVTIPTASSLPPPGKGGSVIVTCRFCSNEIQVQKRSQVDLHEVQYHCHQLLGAHRLPHLSEEVFCKIVYHILFEKFKFTSNSSSNIPNVDKKWACPYCSKEFRCSARGAYRRMQLHLIQKHPDALSSHLRKLQSDPEEVKVKLGSEKVRNKFWGWICVCGCYFTNSNAFVYHRDQYRCKGQSDPSTKSASGSGSQDKCCSHCKAQFLDDGSGSSEVASIHMVQFHLDNFFSEELKGEKVVSQDQFKILLYHFLFKSLDGFTLNSLDVKTGRAWIPCPHCYKTFEYRKKSGRQYCPEMRLHFIRDHWKQLVDKLQVLQMNPGVLKKLEGFKDVGRVCAECGDYLATEELYKEHQREYCKALEVTGTTGAEMGDGRGRGLDADDQGGSLLQVLCKGCGEMVTVGDILEEHVTACPGTKYQDVASDSSSGEGQEEEEEEEGEEEEEEEGEEYRLEFGYGGKGQKVVDLNLGDDDDDSAGQDDKHGNCLGHENDEEEKPPQKKKVKTEEI